MSHITEQFGPVLSLNHCFGSHMSKVIGTFIAMLSCLGHPSSRPLSHDKVLILYPAVERQPSSLQEMLTAAGNLRHFYCAVLSQVERKQHSDVGPSRRGKVNQTQQHF